jgi:hypothetical protein
MRAPIGTWAWLNENAGALSAKERISLISPLAATFGRFTTDRLRLALGVEPRHSASAHELWPGAPDSQLSRHAVEEARDRQSEAMLNHGYRSWVFGEAFAKLDGLALDPELFHAAALLHDVGLEDITPNRCFTHKSAAVAGVVAEQAGTDPDRTLQMMDGIATHITPGLRYEDSALGFYLQAGAMADLAGIRLWQLPKELRGRTDQTYPRREIHRVISRCWHAEAKAVPKGRAHFADALGGFSRIVRWFPVGR